MVRGVLKMSGTAYGVFVIESHYESHYENDGERIHGMWRDCKGTCRNKQEAIDYLDKHHRQGIVTTGSGKIVHIKMMSKKVKPTISYHTDKRYIK